MTRSKKDGARSKHPGGRPRKPKHEKRGEQIGLRIEPELSQRLTAYIARLATEEPAATWTRGAAIRRLMHTALDAEGIKAGEPRRRG